MVSPLQNYYFPFVTSKYLREHTLKLCVYPVSLLPTDSLPASITTGLFVFPSFFPHLLNEILLQGRAVPSSSFIYLFSYLLISIWTPRYLFYFMDYNPMLSLFRCSTCTMPKNSLWLAGSHCWLKLQFFLDNHWELQGPSGQWLVSVGSETLAE